MQLGLAGKVVLVTGGTKSIVLAIVKAFVAEGSIVHFCSRTAADVERTEKDLSAPPTAQAHGSVVNVSSPDAIKTWVSSVAAKSNGRIDVVVSNVSALSAPDTQESWDATYQTDIRGTHTLIEAALPYLKESKGNIVNISSVSGRYVDFTAPGPYGACKAALLHYISGLGHSIAKDGMRANSVSPGNIYVQDGFWGQVEKGKPDFFAQQISNNPTGRMGTPAEVADAVLFLASERATFINAANLLVDGAVSPAIQF
ncbi:short-chain dehydrogenase/reductase SDR [Cryphonectria parasitica EP155]|uniref:Short-chain dehydrogenase/reductase SDR n=1 Tax=Cryphonectria parasitica (strain ATCC 38755 / EP155) TaxID=660469 RepID=A0A9P4Y5A2_CRYP1|nr:short-chain dehydrogenase/reductase SDR [Cryphonectria parasitica EP155]KAF3766936.1 short-chain dehydrogenase/reductase SDR [Cryphonectria parasitica EP155]